VIESAEISWINRWWSEAGAPVDMKKNQRRATVYFDDSLHRALRAKAAVTERSLSDLVNVAIRQSIAEEM